MNKRKEKQIYLLVTVDGDLRIGGLKEREAAVKRIRQIHEDLGLIGHTTWFLNEYDFKWTKYHPKLILNLVETGDLIGIHDHFDTHYAADSEMIRMIATSSYEAISDFFEKYGIKRTIHAHRNGCVHQSKEIYHILRMLGYDILSDVWPEQKWKTRIIASGNGIYPWREIPENESTIC